MHNDLEALAARVEALSECWRHEGSSPNNDIIAYREETGCD